MFFSSGGNLVASANIVDGTIVDADVNAAAAIAATKIAGLIGNPGNIISIDIVAAATYSLTTVAGQRVIVWAKGVQVGTGGGANANVFLKYNGVTKDTAFLGVVNAVTLSAFTLCYSEIPGAATQNVTLTTDYTSISTPVIAVIKLQTT